MSTIKKKEDSTIKYVLKALVPYTEANLKLSFHPNAFFDELDRISARKRSATRSAYYYSLRKKLIEFDDQGLPRLTEKGRRKIRTYKPKKLGKNAKILVIFDIPEKNRWKRDRLRSMLSGLEFERVQRSVWQSNLDTRKYIRTELQELGLEHNVKIYEAVETK